MFGNSSLPPALAARLQGAVDAGLIEANALDPKVLQDLAAGQGAAWASRALARAEWAEDRR